MSDTLKAGRRTRASRDASSAPHAPARGGDAPGAGPAWASASVSAPCPISPAVQREPVIGPADDPYEHEADAVAVADRMVSGDAATAPVPVSRVTAGSLAQRKSVGDATARDDIAVAMRRAGFN